MGNVHCKFEGMKFEARFYCLSLNGAVYAMGCEGGSTKHTLSEIRFGDADEFVQGLICSLKGNLRFNSISFSVETGFIDVDYDIEKQLAIINLWLGHQHPKPQIVHIAPIPYTIEGDSGFGGLQFLMEQGSQFMKTRKDLFIILSSKFLKHCEPCQHEALFDGKHCLRMYMHQKCYLASPFVDVYLRKIDHCADYIKRGLEKCPEGYIPCELCMLNAGFFIFIKEEVCQKRKAVNESDIIFGD